MSLHDERRRPERRSQAQVRRRTAYVIRPLEFGPGRSLAAYEAGEFDVVAADFIDLAKQLGA